MCLRSPSQGNIHDANLPVPISRVRTHPPLIYPVFDDNEHVQHPKRRSDRDEEVTGENSLGMVRMQA